MNLADLLTDDQLDALRHEPQSTIRESALRMLSKEQRECYERNVSELKIRRLLVWYWWTRQRERLVRAIVWRLPRPLVYWSVIRCFAHATTGEFSNCHPDDLTWHDALRRWSEP